MAVLSLAFFIWVALSAIFAYSVALNSLLQFESIGEGESLVSPKGIFELGFFSPGISKNRYLGIWHKSGSVQTFVWIANRCSPIPDSSGLLTINGSGNLVLSRKNASGVWSPSLSKPAKKPILRLLDSGNLVLQDESDENPDAFLWQSFDYPSDTILPGMKLGFSSKTGHKWSMSAWKNTDDPCPAELICGVDPHPYPELAIRKGTAKYYRHGPWNGVHFSGTLNLRPNPISQFVFVQNEKEVYFGYNFSPNSDITRIVLNPTTSDCQQLRWVEAQRSWSLFSSLPSDYCDNYGLCGANGHCIVGNNPVCQCLKGFKPRSPGDWNSLVWADGCVPSGPRTCEDKIKDGFVKFAHTKVPDTTYTWVNRSMNLRECRAKCLRNCSCSAYANTDITGRGSGCVIWFGDLMDTRQIPGGGQDLFIRVPASELAKGNPEMKAAIVAGVVLAAIGILAVSYYMYKRVLQEKNRGKSMEIGGQEEDLELKLFNLSTLNAATDSFSETNKLGEGGFGPVYRGKLEYGQEIAVKRLSLSSGQGVKEFKNEVMLIAKLQHRNLVQLLGCCIQEEEKLLVYEYMANKSLDSFIFDRKKGKQLGWPKRFQTICGIARGLLYLHHDSRLRIVHRDLKASNVLLDSAMNPKISDFGMARTFGGDQMEGNTKRVVGTYGYMAPEYAFNGSFSVKSDIFSFGVMVLEIVSGKRCSSFRPENDNLTLTGHAWQLMMEGRAIELLDPCLKESQILSEVLHCIHVGLLCVQQCPADRPSISSVVFVLGSDHESKLPHPKKPGYFIETDLPQEHQELCPTNYITMSILEAR